MVSGVMRWDSRFFDRERKRRVWVGLTVAANVGRRRTSALDLGEDGRKLRRSCSLDEEKLQMPVDLRYK